MTEVTGESEKAPGFLGRVKALFGRKNVTEPGSPLPDHTLTLFPSDIAEDTQSYSEGRYGHGRDLPGMLKSSARRNTDRTVELRDLARGVRSTLIGRAEADASQIAGMLRFFIAAAWIAVGIYYHQAQTNARINDQIVTASGIPVSDAVQLSSTFFTLGGAAILAAIALLMFVTARAASLKNNIQGRSQNFGLRVAQMLKEYDARLKHHRDALADKTRADESVVAEVSEAHVTAQEAMLLFEDVSFLADARAAETDDQMASAVRSYRHYLATSTGGGASANSAWIEGIAFGAIVGVMIGAGMGMSFLTQLTGYTPTEVIEKLNLDLFNGFEKYPSLLMVIFGGAIAFVSAGGFAGLLSGLVFAPDRHDRLRESLNEIRGAVTAEEAPRAADIARRVEDLSEIFRVRLMGRQLGGGVNASAPATAPGGAQLAQSETEEIPHWRRPKEGPRFVETDFAAAPKSWRTDAYAEYSAKKMRGDPEAKRGFLGLKKPFRD